MPLSYLRDGGYSLGMIRDLPSWEIPDGGVYDQLNMLNDRPGIARQRGGSTNLVSGAQTAFATSLGFCYSQDATNTIEELYGANGKTGAINVINKSTGAATIIAAGTADTTWGRPARHFGFLVFPGTISSTTTPRVSKIVAGAVTNTTFANAAVSQVAAGNPTITLTGADTTTNIIVGAILSMGDATNLYLGRVTSITGAKTFTVWPVPTFTDAAIPISQLGTNTFTLDTAGGSCTTSFQNRLLFGNTFSSAPITEDRRINYGMLPTETILFGGITYSGAFFLNPARFALNYFEAPGSDPVVALEPVNDNQLLILTKTHPAVFSGNLVTQYPGVTSPTVTFDLSDINQPAGCLSDLSVQRTKRGVVWAGANGVYAWDGREPASLTGDDKTKRIASYWQTLASDVATFVIHGSAYVRDHYIVSGSSGGVTFSLACNMQNLQWTRLSGVGTDNFFAVARPSIPQQVFASRWWDQTGAAPSMTNGQTLRIESMLAPYVTGASKSDADGTAVTVSLTTRTITGDADLQKMFQRATIEYQQSSTTATTTVTAQSKIDAADISAASVRSLGSLSNTSVLTLTAATNATPIACTTSANHGLQDDDFVDIDGVTGNTNANGRYRIDVTGNTTFTLVGSSGNGAMGGSPTVKKLTETTFGVSSLNKGQGASVKFDGAPNNLEIHTIKLGVLQQEPATV